ncbi:hypothetical protein CAEBREN_23173 [Caenorhabditis brenneri]|uniref:F-box domain-containing protein n=1 Tax=Caenorhabditis brenneri TaxID=135651 RepID=G0NQW3_CAEBE|nr:hypothetical protein CAEBREN_23173 [Caenorhabditis brenneri]
MTSTFPLLQLPDRAIKTVFKQYGVTDLILFSTISNRAKCLVKSDKRNAYHIEFYIDRGCIVYLNCGTIIFFGESQQRESDIESLTPCAVRVEEQRPPSKISFTLPGYSVRDWLLHFMCVFNHPKINLSFAIRDEWMYSLESVRKIVEGISIKKLSVFENACEIMNYFPIMNSLEVKRFTLEQQLPEEDLNVIRKVLIGNIACLVIYRSIPIDLNMLLLMNCPDIDLCQSSITDKQLNKFIKLWLTGACPNLQDLDLDIVEQYINGFRLDHCVVMKGIKYEEFRDCGLTGCKYTIRKPDGTRALLSISDMTFSFKILDHDNTIS